MSNLVGDFMLRRLSARGVKRIFGYPGDGINGLLGAFDRAGERCHRRFRSATVP